MEDNKDLVTENVTENVEHTTEETPKTYTETEFNERVNEKVKEVMGNRLARTEAKIRKEYESKYGALEETLKAGTGKQTVEELNDTFTKFYESKGIKIKKNPEYSDKEIEILARAEADDIIRYGDEEVVEEVERMAKIGAANMTAKDKAVFKILAEHRQTAERNNELAQIGITEDVYNSKEFQDFAGKFNPNTPIRDIYDIYNKTLPRKEIKTMGSMKNSTSEDGTIKDFYTREEAIQFTKKDFDKNPALFKAVEASMLKW